MCMDQGLCRPLYPCCTTGTPSLLSHLVIPKKLFTSAKVSQYFVREIERTRTMEMTPKTMKLLFHRSQTYHRNWTHRPHWTHWLQQLCLTRLASLTCQPCQIIGLLASLTLLALLVKSSAMLAGPLALSTESVATALSTSVASSAY